MDSIKNKKYRLADNAEIIYWKNSFGNALIRDDVGHCSMVFVALARILTKEASISYDEIKKRVCEVFVGGEKSPAFSEEGLHSELFTLEALHLVETEV